MCIKAHTLAECKSATCQYVTAPCLTDNGQQRRHGHETGSYRVRVLCPLYLILPDVQLAVFNSRTVLGRGAILAPVGRAPGARILARQRVAGPYDTTQETAKYQRRNL